MKAKDRNYTIHKDGSCIWISGESLLVKDENGKKIHSKDCSKFSRAKAA